MADKHYSRFYYIEDFPEFGIINLSNVIYIKPTLRDNEKQYCIYIQYEGVSDIWRFPSQLIRDAALRCMSEEIRNTYTNHNEMKDACEEIAEERKGVAADEAIRVLEKKKEFVDPTDISKFPKVTVE